MKSQTFSRGSSRLAHEPGVVTPMRRLRVFVLLAVLGGWATIICGRLVYLQIFRHHHYMLEAAHEQEHSFEVAPRRGFLYDRDMRPLAMTVLETSIYAVPWQIPDKPAAARTLAAIVHTDPDYSYTSEKQILRRLNASRDFAWIARRQDPPIVAKIKALKMKGLYYQKEFKRFYPDNQLAAQVLGYVGLDDNGLGGLEAEFNRELHGTPGRMYTALDARRRAMSSTERDPQPGESLALTIDENIQFMAEQALEANMQRTHAERGCIIVQDPHTGQILALAMRPTFNPNDFRHASYSQLRDTAVSDVYEPGSVFKIVTYSSALQDGVVTPESMIPTLGGHINVHGRIVHDDRDAIRYEAARGNVLTATQALEQSSDVAAIELAERMGKDTFYNYIREFGFGQRTGIALPGETRGLLKPPQRWQPTTIGSIPMGQEIGVTPLQIVSMASTVANGGVYMPPRIVLERSDDRRDGQLEAEPFHPGYDVPNPLPPGAHRVISTYVAAEMRKMMEGVVEAGTGIPAQLNGYSAAGKTGTAEKIDPQTHTYSKTKYIASFVGFAPVNDPVVTILVVMNSPEYKYHYGTDASAPVFHSLAQQILEYLGVPHDQPVKTTAQMTAIENTPVPEDATPEEPASDLDSLFDEVNDLPADDPLRQKVAAASAPLPLSEDSEDQPTPGGAAPGAAHAGKTVPAKGVAAPAAPMPVTPAPASPPSKASLVVGSGKPVAVPSFAGETVREVIEKAGAAGLGVQVIGSGLARQQVPAAGTTVPQGTQIVVQFGR